MAEKRKLPENITIPTLPSVVSHINQLIGKPGCGTQEIGEAIAQDAPLAAKVLRIANSSYYGLEEPCVSPERASAVLGMRVLRNVVTQAAVITQFEHLTETGFDLDALWRHSILTAQLCSFLASKSTMVGEMSPEEFYTCGLLHDIGRVVLVDTFGEEYIKVVKVAQSNNLPMHVLEMRMLGYDHTDVAATIAARWGLPDPVVRAIRFHHASFEDHEEDRVVALVAGANQMTHFIDDDNLTGAAEVFDHDVAQFLGLKTEVILQAIQQLSKSKDLVEV